MKCITTERIKIKGITTKGIAKKFISTTKPLNTTKPMHTSAHNNNKVFDTTTENQSKKRKIFRPWIFVTQQGIFGIYTSIDSYKKKYFYNKQIKCDTFEKIYGIPLKTQLTNDEQEMLAKNTMLPTDTYIQCIIKSEYLPTNRPRNYKYINPLLISKNRPKKITIKSLDVYALEENIYNAINSLRKNVQQVRDTLEDAKTKIVSKVDQASDATNTSDKNSATHVPYRNWYVHAMNKDIEVCIKYLLLYLLYD